MRNILNISFFNPSKARREAAGFGEKIPNARSAKIMRDERGVAATEFALALPFIMALMLGGFELTRYVIVHQKLEKVAFTISDVVSQSDIVTNAQLGQTVLAASTIMEPDEFSPNGVVFISSVYKQGTSAPTVRWQYKGGGTLAKTSKVGTVGGTATLPAGLTLNDKDNIIISEVYYKYSPLLVGGLFTHDIELYKTTIFKPRLGSLTTPPV